MNAIEKSAKRSVSAFSLSWKRRSKVATRRWKSLVLSGLKTRDLPLISRMNQKKTIPVKDGNQNYDYEVSDRFFGKKD